MGLDYIKNPSKWNKFKQKKIQVIPIRNVCVYIIRIHVVPINDALKSLL